jgi:cyclase
VKGGPEKAYPEFRDHMVASSHEAKLMHPAGPKRDVGKVEIYPIQNNVFLIAGAGSNITAQVGPQGVVLVDGGTGAATAEVMAAVRNLPVPTTKPVRILINTSGDADHAGGNEGISTSAGVRRGDIALVNTPGSTAMNQVKIVAHENVLNRMSAPVNGSDGKAGGQPAVNVDNWPTDTFFDNEKEVYFNGEAVRVHHIVNAHTDGDVIVHFRKADVVATGDIYMTDSYPVIDLAKGGSLQGIIDGLNRVLEIAVPAHHEEGGTMIVPGHGRIADEADLAEYRDMLTIFRDRIQDMIKRGMTLEQIKAARPTMDYDPEYGSTSGLWTIDMFVEAMYKSLMPAVKH